MRMWADSSSSRHIVKLHRGLAYMPIGVSARRFCGDEHNVFNFMETHSEQALRALVQLLGT